MEVICKEVQVFNLITREIHKGTIESFNIKLDKPININALGYDSIITHVKAPENVYKIIYNPLK